MLTPKGLEEKGRLTLRFLKRKLSEYEEIKKQIWELHYEVKEDGIDNPGSELSAAVKSIIWTLQNITQCYYYQLPGYCYVTQRAELYQAEKYPE